MKSFLQSKLILPLVTVVMIAIAVLIPLLSGNAIHSPAASTNDLYVSTTGSDTNPCTQTAPCATIQHGSSLATPGTKVHVAAGTYTVSQITTSTSGNSTAPITYISDTKWGAKLVGSTGRTWEIDGSYITISGFDISNTATTSEGLGIMSYGTHNQVLGNYVHDLASYCNASTGIGGAGIDTSDGGNYTMPTYDTISGNLVERIGPVPGSANYTSCGSLVQAIYISTSNNTVTNNIVHQNSGFCIHLYHNPNNNIIANNDVINCGYSGILVGNDTVGSAQGNYIVNNITDTVGQYGIREYSDSCESTGCGSRVSNNTYINNNTYNSSTGNYFLFGDNDANSGGISVDPQFVNYQPDGTGDYHLAATSPLIDAGTSIDAPSTDFNGIARPQGNGYDIGAYEYVPSTPVAQASVTPTNTPQPTFTSTPTPTVTPTPSPIVDTIPPIVNISNPGNGSSVKHNRR